MADANAEMDRVLKALAQEGVRTSDVQTTGLTMNAVYDYHSYGPPTLRGYHVGQRAQVLVRDLTKGGQAVTAVVDRRRERGARRRHRPADRRPGQRCWHRPGPPP